LTWDDARKELVQRLQRIGVPVMVLVLAEAGKAKEMESRVKQDNPGHFQVVEAGKVEEALAKL
jgi:hypothetical protein